LVILGIAILAILMDISILRQILWFILLSFAPGFLILQILKLDRRSIPLIIVLSTGLSIAFLIFFGLIASEVSVLFGYEKPLSTVSLVPALSVTLSVLSVFAYLRNRNVSFPRPSDLKLSGREKAYLIIPCLFPILSVFGMYLMNSTDNNLMIMALLILVPAYIVFVSIRHNQFPEKVYPPMLLLISISLVLLLALRSSHILGADVHIEYHIFQLTHENGYWSIFTNSTLDSCLSISVLPTIYQSLLNIDPQYLFKVLYPILFSGSVLAVYLTAKRYIGSFYAFLASCFFMSPVMFLWAAYTPRTISAILFFSLAVVVLFSGKIGNLGKTLLFVIFAASCIVSHYSTAYIFLFVLLFLLMVMQILPRMAVFLRKRIKHRNSSEKSPADMRGRLPVSNDCSVGPAPLFPIRRHITIGIAVLFFVILFFWYSQVTGVAFESGVNFVWTTFKSLNEFFVIESRGHVAQAFGSGYETLKIPQQISFFSSWFVMGLIVIGIVATVVRYLIGVPFIRRAKGKDRDSLLQSLDLEFLSLALACFGILAVSVILPYVAKAYTMDRTFLQMVVVLAPFFVLGGLAVGDLLHIKWRYVVVLAAFVPYFLCNTGMTAQLFGWPRDIILNSEGQTYDMTFVHDEETSAARWLKFKTDEGSPIYSDDFGERRLISQGGLRAARYAGNLVEDNEPIDDGYLFLRYTATVDGRLMDNHNKWYDISEYNDSIGIMNKVYTNGGAEIMHR